LACPCFGIKNLVVSVEIEILIEFSAGAVAAKKYIYFFTNQYSLVSNGFMWTHNSLNITTDFFTLYVDGNLGPGF